MRVDAKFEATRSLPVWDDTSWVPPPGTLGRHDTYDVVIIGAGFTGLWTAHHLIERDPTLAIAVLDAHHPGFGASGRNGGWCSALFAAELPEMSALHGERAAIAMQRSMFETVDEIGNTALLLGIDCGWVKGGTLTAATARSQMDRLQRTIKTYRRFGFGDDDIALLDGESASDRIRAEGTRAALFTPHCAAINPWKLITGMTESLVSRGVGIFSNSRVTSLSSRRVAGEDINGLFTVEARWVVRATEAYTAQLRDHHREIIPVYSYMVATEPLGEDVWAEIGWAGRETFADLRQMIIYAQRTADDRIAFGGRGVGYRFGSRLSVNFEQGKAVHRRIIDTMHRLFPATREARITHRWGGPLAVPRDWHPSVVFNSERRIATAGGYVGDGVASAHLAGRTIAEVITGQQSEICRLPWVNHVSRKWEPEPFRWMGMNAVSRLVRAADAVESVTQRPARRLSSLIERITG